MDPDLKKLYARAIDTPAGKCFCLVMSGADVDGDGFDVTVFHARSLRTYAGKNLRAPPRWIKPDLWMPLALRALATETAPEGVRFNFNPDTGALSWTWPAKEVGMSAGAQQAVMLKRVELGVGAGVGGGGGGEGGNGGSASTSTSTPLEDMMATVWESCYRLMVSCRQLDSQLQRQSDCLSRTRRELQDCTERHKSLVQELHVKFARVLDAKKDKLIEQRARIQELEEQLAAAKQELELLMAETQPATRVAPLPASAQPTPLLLQPQQPLPPPPPQQQFLLQSGQGTVLQPLLGGPGGDGAGRGGGGGAAPRSSEPGQAARQGDSTVLKPDGAGPSGGFAIAAAATGRDGPSSTIAGIRHNYMYSDAAGPLHDRPHGKKHTQTGQQHMYPKHEPPRAAWEVHTNIFTGGIKKRRRFVHAVIGGGRYWNNIERMEQRGRGRQGPQGEKWNPASCQEVFSWLAERK
ncbi:hypothetical protein VOLCADRAFT_105502 [Volvox carteri f. nagariensis]|uniref:Uncharacterized protein n=1 Tax=Volvox carteri f. nagariensis TaxID=3068 RepID=D8U115_VOLCA|nr:uncharacterized protein VOLCADRAFT_105502 [Volvox carteri f. nagariensis]EFJ46597.1 hypothetical protein VOLCADRAFT_105502 [Volvox carteri f. nagariensis]|eukprot:XP_002952454.1 hypothetical protein VOLCADRAFT_105502 [Volvox carteri f. nagariensis]